MEKLLTWWTQEIWNTRKQGKAETLKIIARVGIKGSISWSHKPKIQRTSIFHQSFFPKHDKIIRVGDISICLELNEWDWSMKGKNSVECFGLFYSMSLYINMKNDKNIACTDFVNVNIALNLHSYEDNYSFSLEFIKKD